tara:strand:- start:4 stop:486 length:483 start_codon:yes stop_codon:yes gene_type:complete
MSQTTLSETMKNKEIFYETMYILRPDIAEEEVNEHIEKYNKLLESMGGKILDSQMRGKRRLAYPISKNREGIYVQLSHQGDGQHIEKIEKAMRLSEDVIRYMTIKQDGPLPTPKPKIKPAENTNNRENEKSEDHSATVVSKEEDSSKNNLEKNDKENSSE